MFLVIGPLASFNGSWLPSLSSTLCILSSSLAKVCTIVDKVLTKASFGFGEEFSPSSTLLLILQTKTLKQQEKLRVKRKFTQVIRITSQFLAFLVALWNHNPQIFQQVETKKKLETYS